MVYLSTPTLWQAKGIEMDQEFSENVVVLHIALTEKIVSSNTGRWR
jgi:hypothetical protein